MTTPNPVTPPRTRPLLPLSVLALLLVGTALAGCGGDDEGEEVATTTTQAERPAATATTTGGGQPQQGGQGDGDTASGGGDGGATGDTSGNGATPGAEQAAPGVPVSPGGDNSIQTYGEEGEVSDREQAATATRAYLSARAAGNYRRACDQASSGLKQSLGQPTGGSGGCPAALRALTEGVPESTLRRVARVGRILSFRTEGEQAFLIFRSGGTVKYMPMASEGGGWKVGAIEPSEFFLGP